MITAAPRSASASSIIPVRKSAPLMPAGAASAGAVGEFSGDLLRRMATPFSIAAATSAAAVTVAGIVVNNSGIIGFPESYTLVIQGKPSLALPGREC